jgi:hypothetical protein
MISGLLKAVHGRLRCSNGVLYLCLFNCRNSLPQKAGMDGIMFILPTTTYIPCLSQAWSGSVLQKSVYDFFFYLGLYILII